ncbi:hypothetical protein [Nocardioides sp. CFH 31398]|uniref:hypothetical protein n=1 Tax=Nocardioides sp. CFH 31398 TaxID=2919579 RepID=UPI001F06E6D8|nr:hypothetical protein [Nocardioides sp. CFH 31398]MCH1868506.1 hypothetical protein [Nocardioides sp. CFH 31398]
MVDHVRRAVVVVLTALAFIVAPQVASATFSDPESPALAVSTASLTEPANVAVTGSCGGGVLSRGITVSVNGFAGNDYAGATFAYTLYRGTGSSVADTETTSSRTVTLTAPNQFLGSGTFRVTIQPRLASWTGPTFTRTFTC